ncbi:alpha-N-acetylglucosaminidase C-terminal domain-containing protein [Actinopolymorpha pittospori]|uniref:alpha-N-acetylglucosaminidase C-terminal domain-containing protein n=1 Tax=Actinopolymorpha pittospori TaxID=648752 RepID=UPI003B589159
MGEVEAGWRELIKAAPQASESERYRHDLVDATVQVLSDRRRWRFASAASHTRECKAEMASAGSSSCCRRPPVCTSLPSCRRSRNSPGLRPWSPHERCTSRARSPWGRGLP